MPPEATNSKKSPEEQYGEQEMSKQSAADAKHEQHTDESDAEGRLSLEDALRMYDDSKKYVDTGHRTNWDNYFRVYKGQRVIRNYEGVSDPVIRESHTIIETLVANIAGGNPKFHFVQTNEEQAKDTEVINEMLDYYMVCNQMGLKNQEWVRDMLLYGTGILGVEWRKGKPFIFNIPLRDFFIDPTCTGLVQTLTPARYAGYEYLQDKDVLKREKIYDAEKDEWVPRYKNLEKIGFDTAKGKDTGDNKGMDKAFKDMFMGSTLGDEATKRQVHVIKLHDLMTGRIYEIGNRKEFIYDEPTWCQREEITREVEVEGPDGQFIKVKQTLDEIEPFLPFAVLRDYIDSSQFYAEGEMALLIYDAELLNDYEAMQVDNNAYQNTPMYWIDPQFADLAPEIETIPGAVYPIPRNAMGALERPQLSGDLDNKQERIMQRMRRATAADEAVQGGSVGNSRTTATEVSTQLQQAQMRFATKIQNLENEGYAQLALIIFKLVQIFVTKKTAMRIVGKNGVYFKDFDPWEYNGEWEAHAQLDTTIKQKQMEVGMKDNQIYEIITDDPYRVFNPVEVKRWMMQKIDPTLSDEDFNKLLAPPEPPKDDVKDIATINYKDATPHTKAQMELKAGYQPDPMHEVEAQTMLMEHASRGVDLMNPATDTNDQMLPGMEQIMNPQPATAPEGMAA
ncbi:portal protein [Caudoviricetes sp.]|nr:portal protein [Caudoviricetes sp.]